MQYALWYQRVLVKTIKNQMAVVRALNAPRPESRQFPPALETQTAKAGVFGQCLESVSTLQTLTKDPGLGRLRFQGWRELSGLRSWRVQRPYHRHLIFYRFDKDTLIPERVLHGARDLPRRLLQSPYEDG